MRAMRRGAQLPGEAACFALLDQLVGYRYNFDCPADWGCCAAQLGMPTLHTSCSASWTTCASRLTPPLQRNLEAEAKLCTPC